MSACKSITFVTAMQAGAAPDIIARRLGQQVAEDSANSVTAIVENNGVGSGNSAASSVARRADCNFLITSVVHSALPTLHPESKALYDKLQPTALIGKTPLVLAVHKNGPKTLAELIAASKAKASQGGLSYATNGLGSAAHLDTDRMLRHFGAPGTPIPFQGPAGSLNALLGGHIDFMLVSPASVAGSLDSLRILGVARDAPLTMPGLETAVLPLAPGVKFIQPWLGIYASPGTDKTGVGRMHESLQRMLQNPEFRKTFEQDFSMELGRGVSVEQFAEFSAQETKDMKTALDALPKP